MKTRLINSLFILPLIFLSLSTSYATGFFGPSYYLSGGGKLAKETPQFYWELEVKRIAQDFHPSEKLVFPTIPKDQYYLNPRTEDSLRDLTGQMDAQDFEAALKEKRISPSDVEKARAQHLGVRKMISEGNATTILAMPPEFDSEFSDYHRGALAFRQGRVDEAKAAWTALLKRPVEQRHYRTIWATYMLGKLALKQNDSEAVKWFQQTRILAKKGFADSLGMAADSYGWEAKFELDQKHMEKAAELYLTQLALGDESAVVSLGSVIPTSSASPAELSDAVKSPLLRRLTTVSLLANHYDIWNYEQSSNSRTKSLLDAWLGAIEKAHLKKIEDAEYIGWIAYNDGKYDDAKKWLKLTDKNAPAACWLRSRLQSRDGDLDDATESMTQALQSIQGISPYTGWKGNVGKYNSQYCWRGNEGEDWYFDSLAAGDLAAIHLQQNQFVEALDVFFKARMLDDVSYLAERVLTTKELKEYVDKQPIPKMTQDEYDPTGLIPLRHALARRLIRGEKYQEAMAYIPDKYKQILADYAQAINNGSNAKLSKLERAHAWFTAAYLAKRKGSTLFGEVGDIYRPYSQEDSYIADQRLSGTYKVDIYGSGAPQSRTIPIALKSTDEERERLVRNKFSPEEIYRIQHIAAFHALRAAKLLPNNSEELADALNIAGLCIKESDNKLADQYYYMVERRCPTTQLGAKIISQHWFVYENGLWSNELEAKYP